MSFMKKQIEDARGSFEVTCEDGSVFYVSAWDAESTSDFNAMRPEAYTSSVQSVRVLTTGYLARLSAPGYLDCTDWEYGTDKHRLLRSL